MKLLLAALIVTPLVLLIVGSVRGRVQVRSCCAVPAEADGRMASAYRTAAPEVVSHDAQNASTGPIAH